MSLIFPDDSINAKQVSTLLSNLLVTIFCCVSTCNKLFSYFLWMPGGVCVPAAIWQPLLSQWLLFFSPISHHRKVQCSYECVLILQMNEKKLTLLKVKDMKIDESTSRRTEWNVNKRRFRFTHNFPTFT